MGALEIIWNILVSWSLMPAIHPSSQSAHPTFTREAHSSQASHRTEPAAPGRGGLCVGAVWKGSLMPLYMFISVSMRRNGNGVQLKISCLLWSGLSINQSICSFIHLADTLSSTIFTRNKLSRVSLKYFRVKYTLLRTTTMATMELNPQLSGFPNLNYCVAGCEQSVKGGLEGLVANIISLLEGQEDISRGVQHSTVGQCGHLPV